MLHATTSDAKADHRNISASGDLKNMTALDLEELCREQDLEVTENRQDVAERMNDIYESSVSAQEDE